MLCLFPQVHIVFSHVTQFIEGSAVLNDDTPRGLGWFSEQAFESGKKHENMAFFNLYVEDNLVLS